MKKFKTTIVKIANNMEHKSRRYWFIRFLGKTSGKLEMSALPKGMGKPKCPNQIIWSNHWHRLKHAPSKKSLAQPKKRYDRFGVG